MFSRIISFHVMASILTDPMGLSTVVFDDGASLQFYGPMSTDCEPILVSQRKDTKTEIRNYTVQQLQETIKTNRIRWFNEPIIKQQSFQTTLF